MDVIPPILDLLRALNTCVTYESTREKKDSSTVSFQCIIFKTEMDEKVKT